MATRAVSRAKPDWSKIASQLKESDARKFNKLKSQCDATSINVSSLPESLPKVDWAFYKAHASDPKLVEELEKKYSSIKVSLPKVPASRLNDLKRAKEQDEARYNKFATIAKEFIQSADVVKEKFEKMIPVPEMTMEEWCLTFPYWSPASIENPSVGNHYGRCVGLSLEEQIAFEQPDPIPYATKTAWKDWEERKKKFYS